jgi:hypothetical protein
LPADQPSTAAYLATYYVRVLCFFLLSLLCIHYRRGRISLLRPLCKENPPCWEGRHLLPMPMAGWTYKFRVAKKQTLGIVTSFFTLFSMVDDEIE